MNRQHGKHKILLLGKTWLSPLFNNQQNSNNFMRNSSLFVLQILSSVSGAEQIFMADFSLDQTSQQHTITGLSFKHFFTQQLTSESSWGDFWTPFFRSTSFKHCYLATTPIIFTVQLPLQLFYYQCTLEYMEISRIKTPKKFNPTSSHYHMLKKKKKKIT